MRWGIRVALVLALLGAAPSATAVTPKTRYDLANRCFGLAGEPIYFKPTGLGSYLLYDRDARLVSVDEAGRRHSV